MHTFIDLIKSHQPLFDFKRLSEIHLSLYIWFAVIVVMKVPEEPEYDPEVIANAHLTMEDDHYKCSVCKMKFKQPGNARRHIITVHRFVTFRQR